MSKDILTHLSLFSGIGGIDIAAEDAGFVTVGQCEMDKYATKVLIEHWPDVPKWRDIRELTAKSFYEKTGMRTVDLISGGFPCQPFSVAGKQAGKKDERYLWPEMLRVIRELAPRWVVGENVPGILRIAADDICKSLERENYDIGIFDYEAASVGALHRRERIFFVANSRSASSDTLCGLRKIQSENREQRQTSEFRQSSEIPADVADSNKRTGRSGDESVTGKTEQLELGSNGSDQRGVMADTGQQSARSAVIGFSDRQKDCGETRIGSKERNGFADSGQDVSDSDLQRCEEQRLTIADETQPISELRCEIISHPDNGSGIMRRNGELSTITEAQRTGSDIRRGTPEYVTRKWWSVEPNVGRVAHGIPHRVDRLKCLGNAVVPQQIYPILMAIAAIEKGEQLC